MTRFICDDEKERLIALFTEVFRAALLEGTPHNITVYPHGLDRHQFETMHRKQLIHWNSIPIKEKRRAEQRRTP
jgi:hypothetical protein